MAAKYENIVPSLTVMTQSQHCSHKQDRLVEEEEHQQILPTSFRNQVLEQKDSLQM